MSPPSPLLSFLRRQEPIPPEDAPPAEQEPIPRGGQGGASCPLSLDGRGLG